MTETRLTIDDLQIKDQIIKVLAKENFLLQAKLDESQERSMSIKIALGNENARFYETLRVLSNSINSLGKDSIACKITDAMENIQAQYQDYLP
jgi:hypothetical protein